MGKYVEGKGWIRGFAALSPEKRRQIAAMGGRSAHKRGTAHRFTKAEAAAAGSKGGKASQSKGTAHQFTSDEARKASKKRKYPGRRRKSTEDADGTNGS